MLIRYASPAKAITAQDPAIVARRKSVFLIVGTFLSCFMTLTLWSWTSLSDCAVPEDLLKHPQAAGHHADAWLRCLS